MESFCQDNLYCVGSDRALKMYKLHKGVDKRRTRSVLVNC